MASAPTASGTTVTKTPGQSTSLTSLFSYFDPDNDIVMFAVKDRELGGGYLTKNGIKQTENLLFDSIPIAQIGQWAFVAGPAGSSSTIGFNAIDSRGAFNQSVTSTVNVPAAVLHDPTASGHSVTKAAGESTPLASLFSYSDLDNDIVSFAVKDREVGGGYLTKNGTKQTENFLFDPVPIGQIGQWAFVAGPAGSTSTIGFNAIDSRGAFNPSVTSTVSVATPTPTDVVPDTPGTASSFLNLEQSKPGKIDSTGQDGLAGDSDVYKVTLAAAHTYTFSANANGNTGDTLDQVFIRLYGPAGGPLTPDLTAGGSGAPQFTSPVITGGGGTYYFAISADGAGTTWKSKTGDYSILVHDNGFADAVADSTSTTTTALPVGQTTPGKIDSAGRDGNAGDNDFYKVTLAGGHTYRFTANAGVSSSDTLDTVFIRLYDPTGQKFTPDIFAESGNPSIVSPVIPGSATATYYLAISAGGAGDTWKAKTGDYTIAVADNGIGSTDDYRDSLTDTSAPLGVLTAGSARNGVIVPETGDVNGDKDVFQVRLDANKTYELSLQGMAVGASSALAVGLFTIRNDQFTTLATSPEGSSSTLRFVAPYSGDYYVRVGAGGTAFATAQGGYQIGVAELKTTTGSATPVSSGFRHPLGDGRLLTEAWDGDGYYVARNHSQPAYNDNGTFRGYHRGEDWNAESSNGAADLGTSVLATSNGRVWGVFPNDGWGTGWGNVVIVEHVLPTNEYGGKVYSFYAHLDSIGVSKDQLVTKGQAIGTLGGTGGYSPHLHFEIRTAESLTDHSGYPKTADSPFWVDPTDFIASHQSFVPGTTTEGDLADGLLTLGSVSLGSSATSVLEQSQDRDWFKVASLVAGKDYRIEVTGEAFGGNPALADTFFTLRDDTGARLTGQPGREQYGSFSYDNVNGSNAVVELTPTKSGTYYIAIGAGNPNNASLTGGYRVSVNEIAEPGETVAAAQDLGSLTGARSLAGFAGFGADSGDYFRFSVTSRGAFTADLTGLGADANIYLLDKSEQQLKQSQHNGITAESIFTDLAAGDYYLKVVPYTQDGIVRQTPYKLNLDFHPASGGTGSKTASDLFAIDGNKLVTMADFSVAAYEGASGEQARDALVAKGWRLLDGSDLNLSSVFGGIYSFGTGAALLAQSSDALVIAFRGTGDWADIATGWFTPKLYYLQFLALVDAIEKYQNPAIETIYVTGHSLGGAMAQVYMDSHSNTVGGRSYESMTFASPGSPFFFDEDRRTVNFRNEDDPIRIVSDGDLAIATVAVVTALAGYPSLAKNLLDLNKIYPSTPGDNNVIFYGADNLLYIPRLPQHDMSLYDATTRFMVHEAGKSGLGFDGLTSDFKYFVVPSSSELPVEPSSEVSVFGNVTVFPELDYFDVSGRRYFNYGWSDDALTGSTSPEVLASGVSKDVLNGGGGNDLLLGGDGDDTYVFDRVRNLGDATIADSSGSSDKLDLSTIPNGYDIGLKQSAANDLVVNFIRSSDNGTEPGSSITIKSYFADNHQRGGSGEIEAVVLPGARDSSQLWALWLQQNDPTSAGFTSNGSNFFQLTVTQPTLDFGTGNDTASYEDLWGYSVSTAPVATSGTDKGFIATIRDMFGSIVHFGGDGGGGDSSGASPESTDDGQLLLAVENIYGTPNDDQIAGDDVANWLKGGDGKDVLTGGPGDDILDGGAADDTVNGESGNDVLMAGAGFDILDGGADTDTVDFSAFASAIYVNLASGTEAWTTDRTDMSTGTWRFISDFSRIENVIGTEQSDILRGDAGNNVLTGRDGRDVILYAGGSDVLDGGAGEDTADFSGFGSAIYVNLAADSEAWTADGADMNSGAWRFIADFVSIQDLVGTGNADILRGDGGNNVFGARGGNDTLMYSGGFDIFDGGTGNDTADFSVFGSAVYVNLSGESEAWTTDGADMWSGTWRFISDFSSVENVVGTASADLLRGDAVNNVLAGRQGDDTLMYTAGFDVLDGGIGTDAGDFSAFGSAVYVNLGAQSEAWTADATDMNSGTWRFIADFTSIENVVGSAYGDTLRGDAGDNVLVGGQGNDTLMYTGGFDILDGAAGRDSADFSGFVSAVYVNLSRGSETWTTDGADMWSGVWRFIADFTAIEDVVGSAQSDILIGDAGNNVLSGRGGSDTLAYAGGFDLLDGGVGNDSADFSTFGSAIYVNLASDSEAWTTDGADMDSGTWRYIADFSNIENVIGTGQSDILRGDAGDNVLGGRSGNDTLMYAGGFDLLDGGTGSDAADFSAFGSAVYVNLASATAAWTTDQTSMYSGTWRYVSSFVSIETVVGSSQSDILTGDSGGNLLAGREGNDTLTGGSGDDILSGGAGSDTFRYANAGQGFDTITDFTRGPGGDALDLREALTGYNGLVANFLQVSNRAGNTAIAVNADGVGTDFVSLLMLQGVAPTASLLNDMLAQGNLILS